MITVTGPTSRPTHPHWLVVGVGIGALTVLVCAGVLGATHLAVLADVAAAARSAIGRGCAELSCVLDAGSGHASVVLRAGASLVALVRAVLAFVG